MVVEEYALIQVSKSNKKKLDNLKLFERETYNFVLSELIRFGEENRFKKIRIEKFNKKMVQENGKNEINKGSIKSATI